jgi:hypothetical protein
VTSRIVVDDRGVARVDVVGELGGAAGALAGLRVALGVAVVAEPAVVEVGVLALAERDAQPVGVHLRGPGGVWHGGGSVRVMWVRRGRGVACELDEFGVRRTSRGQPVGMPVMLAVLLGVAHFGRRDG